MAPLVISGIFEGQNLAKKNSKLTTGNCKSASVREKMSRFLPKIEVSKKTGKWQNLTI